MNKDKGVPVGFLRGDASDEEIREFLKKLNAAMGAPNEKPSVKHGRAAVKKEKPVKGVPKRRPRS